MKTSSTLLNYHQPGLATITRNNAYRTLFAIQSKLSTFHKSPDIDSSCTCPRNSSTFYYTLLKPFCQHHGVNNIIGRVLHPIVDIYRRDSNIYPFWDVVFPAISWPSSQSTSFCLFHNCFGLGSCSGFSKSTFTLIVFTILTT